MTLNTPTEKWNDCLCNGVRSGNMALVRKSIKHHNADVNIVDNEGNTPLAIASRQGNLRIMRYLLNQQADIFKKGAQNQQKSALEWAITRGHLDAVKLLLTKVPYAKVGAEPLIYAIQQNKLKIVQFLINSNYSNVFKCTRNGRTPLAEAALCGHLNIVKFFVEKGAILDQVDYEGNTPLALAIQFNRTAVAKMLILMGANVCKFVRGKPLLVWAVLGRNLDIIEALLESEFDDDSVIECAKNVAVTLGDFEIVKLLAEGTI